MWRKNDRRGEGLGGAKEEQWQGGGKSRGIGVMAIGSANGLSGQMGQSNNNFSLQGQYIERVPLQQENYCIGMPIRGCRGRRHWSKEATTWQ